MSVLRLAIPSPLRRQFDYLPPEGLDRDEISRLSPGQRLLVPFGRREVTGYLLGVHTSSDIPAASLKPAIALLDTTPLISPDLLQLCAWAANYYQHPLGEVLAAAFPKRLRQGKDQRASGLAGWQLTTQGKGLPAGALTRSPRQAQALSMLQASKLVTQARLIQGGVTTGVMRALQEKGLAEKCTMPEQQEPPVIGPGLALNPEQLSAFESMRASDGHFQCHLLEGVTGSGKTEIYLQLIAACLLRERQALVLIPEIGLTPQTLDRFQQRFDTQIAVLHSGLGDAQRYQAWEAARSGRARIVIGTRSAIFTPLQHPGLIIVDEEHDGSYKQQDGFRYSARDVAVKRAQLEDCPILLGSATPSLETLHNALSGRYQHHRLLQRAGNSQMPAIETIDLRRQSLHAGLSNTVIEAVEHTLLQGQQSLLFLNRRGYAPTLQCHDCGWLGECHQCDARLTVHRRQRRLRCHHCGHVQALPRECPSCHSDKLMAAGLGTEQTEEFLRTHFGDRWPIHRVDSDSMQGRDAMQDLVDDINRGEPCILLGTQMLTKGHHFPAVSLVAIIDVDAMLFSADFRGEERMAQLLTQVSGRSGRAELPGRVLLQSHYPDHPALQAMLDSPYADLARELIGRRLEAGLPPAGRLVIVRTDCSDAQRGEQFLRDLRTLAEPTLPTGASLIGPLPSPMQRRAGKFRSQLLLTANSWRAAHQSAGLLVQCAESQRAARDLKWTIDVDPQDVF